MGTTNPVLSIKAQENFRLFFVPVQSPNGQQVAFRFALRAALE